MRTVEDILIASKHPHTTLMYREAGQAAACVENQISQNVKTVQSLAARLRHTPPPLVVTCARGSSDCAATYAKYLIENTLGIPVLSMAPSVNSVYRVRQNIKGALFIAISQSGRSPDILLSAKAAKAAGAHIAAIVNDTASPLAGLADTLLPLCAGDEKSVAATKSYICSLSAIFHLTACWSQEHELQAGILAIPDALNLAFEMDWSSAIAPLLHAQNMFVVGRGLGLCSAQEAALKFKETCGLHAESYSAAEVKHGPMALVKKDFPVLVFASHDESQTSLDDIVDIFSRRGAAMLCAGKRYDGTAYLPVPSGLRPEVLPLVQILSFYKFVNALSLQRGYSPDTPPFLNKVTETK